MNKLKTIGISALAGSLAAFSAQAFEASVSGGAEITVSHKGSSDVTGNPLGARKNLNFSGSGELDNGWSVALATNLTDANALSSSTTALTMGSLGTITVGQGHGGNSGGWDEEVPQAYEQVSDAGTATAANYVGSWLGNGAVGWALPSIDTGAGSLSVKIGFANDADNVAVSDGGTGGHGGVYGEGYDLGVTLATDMGLTLGAYVAERENKAHVPTGSDATRDEFNGTWYVTYSAGPVSIGYQESYVDLGAPSSTATAATAAKTIGTSTGIYEDQAYSISFNVNDDLSVSYTSHDSTYDDQSNVSSGTEIADVTQSQDAIQVAYSMGGLSISAYQMSTTNPAHDSNAGEINVTEIAVGMAF